MDITSIIATYGTRIFEAIWSVTDVIGVAFAILGTTLFRMLGMPPEEPEDPKDRTFLQKHLPAIPVVLGTVYVIAISKWGTGDWRLLVNRAVGTGTFALFAHKYFNHWWKET